MFSWITFPSFGAVHNRKQPVDDIIQKNHTEVALITDLKGNQHQMEIRPAVAQLTQLPRKPIPLKLPLNDKGKYYFKEKELNKQFQNIRKSEKT